PRPHPPHPDCDGAGASGATAERFAVVTASARSVPPLASGHAVVMLSNVIATWPPTTSCSAGGLPLYGMSRMSTPAMLLKSSPDKCCDVPLPLDANEYLPGLAFNSVINSVTFCAGMSGLTTRRFG